MSKFSKIFLSFLFRLRYLMQGRMSGTPTSQSKQESNSLDRANMHNSRNSIQGHSRESTSNCPATVG